ncbi:MAG TPA: hypothetical protein VFP84_15495 [Kofleriaceae bacterium]|nr:hypothetical protein [Kofleriaceae bacterium]
MLNDNEYVDFCNLDLRIVIDLTHTPKRTDVNHWSKVRIDDRGIDKAGNELPNGMNMSPQIGITTIGSGSADDPKRGVFYGGVYLEHSYFERIRATKLRGWPENPGDFKLHELTSIAYSGDEDNGPRAKRRYHGFTAQVVEINHDQVTFDVDEHARPTKTRVTFTIGDASKYDPAPPSEALGGALSLASNLVAGQPGALFLELKEANQYPYLSIKLPIGEGQ